MAGLFGFFNYEKEGPGIDKNAPQKHTFIVFFETFFRNIWKFIPINLVYVIMSLPVVTAGFANVGITNVARNIARDKHSFGLSDFFETIKKNLKQALWAGLLNTVVYILIAINISFYLGIKDNQILQTIGFSFVGVIFFVFTVMNYYLWTLIITFKYTLKQAYLNSFRFVFVNLKKNLLCFFINLLIVAGAFLLGISVLFALAFELLLFILVYPCFRALLIQYCTFPAIKKYIIDPYYQEHPEEDLQKRHDLGLDLPKEESTEEDDDDCDVIFED